MRTQKEIIREYQRWKERAVADGNVIKELKRMEEQEIRDAFCQELTFGTGGLRSILGAGTNRLNVYTVAKATQGVADYIKKSFLKPDWKVAIAYDSRIQSDVFAKAAAAIFADQGIRVLLYPEIMPTPCVSFAVRELSCVAGIVITASHNPAQYNGYKVYGADGCQITTEDARRIQKEIHKLDVFDDVRLADFEEGIARGRIQFISENVYQAYLEAVKEETLTGIDTPMDKSAAIIYSPLNGTGLKPVLRTLKESGYSNIKVVEEQEQPDGRFPTCPYPNPEDKKAMELGIWYAKREQADLLLATDPDCDRLGIAVRRQDGDYVLLSGNETGVLLLDYICSRRREMGTMPAHPIAIKTIVTTDMAERVAKHYGVKMVNVLTGFKFIGEQIGLLEQKNQLEQFLFGLEESYGYLSGTHVRDKDGVNAAFLTCEMFAYYKAQGIGLYEKLQELYKLYGYTLDIQHCIHFEGADGQDDMNQIMHQLRKGIDRLGGKKVQRMLDYQKGINGLPKADVVKFLLEDHCSVTIRPSGTEPKLKVYLSICGEKEEQCRVIEERMIREVKKLISCILILSTETKEERERHEKEIREMDSYSQENGLAVAYSVHDSRSAYTDTGGYESCIHIQSEDR